MIAWRFHKAFALAALAAGLLRAAIHWHFFLKKNAPIRRLAPSARARAAHYRYGTVWLCCWFRATGLRPASGWHARMSVLAVLSAQFDDLRERAPQDPAPTPDAFGHSADPLGPTTNLLAELRRSLPQAAKADFETTLQALYEAEAEALRADQDNLAALQTCAARKGAWAARLYALVYCGRRIGAEPTASFGAYVQCCDDILDAWFDRRDGLATPALFFLEKKQNPHALAGAWQKAWERLSTETARHVKAGNGQRAMGVAALMAAVTLLALRRYAGAGPIQPWHARRSMVLDMSRPGNVLSALRQLSDIPFPNYCTISTFSR